MLRRCGGTNFFLTLDTQNYVEFPTSLTKEASLRLTRTHITKISSNFRACIESRLAAIKSTL